MDLKQITHADNVRLSDDGRAVRILDQSRLPNETVHRSFPPGGTSTRLSPSSGVGPAIGIFAGYALYVLVSRAGETFVGPFVAECRKHQLFNASWAHGGELKHMLTGCWKPSPCPAPT